MSFQAWAGRCSVSWGDLNHVQESHKSVTLGNWCTQRPAWRRCYPETTPDCRIMGVVCLGRQSNSRVSRKILE